MKLISDVVFNVVDASPKASNYKVYYFVTAGKGNKELRACNYVLGAKTLDEAYTLLGVEKHPTFGTIPVVVSKQNPTTFPHYEWEYTAYSLDDHSMEFFAEKYESVEEWLNHLFWDSSTEYMVKFGLPTQADIEQWKRMVATDKFQKFTNEQKESLITIMKEYLEPEKL